jgi:manganese transport protein
MNPEPIGRGEPPQPTRPPEDCSSDARLPPLGSAASHSGWLRALGPAIIVASVVLGPGSIVSASRVGCELGNRMVWVPVLAGILMFGMTVLSARVGVGLPGTPCEELARRLGRPVAVLAGATLFFICACFQFGNNLGVLAAVEPFVPLRPGTPAYQTVWIGTIVALNALVLVALFGFRRLYQPVERTMKVLVGLMMLGFLSNLVLARPDLTEVLAGLWPSLPDDPELARGAWQAYWPHWRAAPQAEASAGRVVDSLLPVTALIATTFSVGGAYYQAYLVRQKGWSIAQVRRGLVDSAVGITTLVLMTLMILVTAATVLHGKVRPEDLASAADVARQLRPAFGDAATALFCAGIFAGAFSSFLVNAMIGGTVLSDALGLGGHIDQPWPRRLTALALGVGMVVAISTTLTGKRPVVVLIVAQALTTLGLPILAAALLYLAWRREGGPRRCAPLWMRLLALCGLLLSLVLAARTATTLYLQWTH